MTLFADPNRSIDTATYSQLIRYGFRRSGGHIYRPRCPLCDACIPIRVVASAFTPNRSQRRNWQNNADIDVSLTPVEFQEEHYALYRRYISQRHAGGGMDCDEPEKYQEFLLNPDITGALHEFRLQGKLVAVAVVDHLENALSAVYTFFDERESRRGLGVFAVLHLLDYAKMHHIEHVYLGYWIARCQKMAYKHQYRPFETFHNGQWELFIT
jgi:arginine-tRNA-protein transferase